MYGYVVINQPELKFKEYDIYRSYYCGLCHVLKEKYSLKGQMSISYDMTFLVMLLTGLYEPDITYIEEKPLCSQSNIHNINVVASKLLFFKLYLYKYFTI